MKPRKIEKTEKMTEKEIGELAGAYLLEKHHEQYNLNERGIYDIILTRSSPYDSQSHFHVDDEESLLGRVEGRFIDVLVYAMALEYNESLGYGYDEISIAKYQPIPVQKIGHRSNTLIKHIEEHMAKEKEKSGLQKKSSQLRKRLGELEKILGR